MFWGLHGKNPQSGSTSQADGFYEKDGEIKSTRNVSFLKSLIFKFKDYNSGLFIKGDGDSSGAFILQNKHNSFWIYSFKNAIQFWSSKANKEFLKYFVETDKLEVNSGIRIAGRVYDANTNKPKSNANIETDENGKMVLVEKVANTVEDTGWIPLTQYLVNGWSQFNNNYPILYRKIGNIVYLQGLVKKGTKGTIFKDLPDEIRPKHKVYLANAIGEKNVKGTKHLGLVVWNNGHLESKMFSQEWTSIACSYILD